MGFLKMTTPDWVQTEIDKKQIPQQRTIMPQSTFMGGQPTGLRAPQRPGQPDMDYSNRQDYIPATLRSGEEVIPPEIVKALGGRDAFIATLNERLPHGLRMTGGRGPVQGGDAENASIDGTLKLAQPSPSVQGPPLPQPGAQQQPQTQPGTPQTSPQGQPEGMACGGTVMQKEYRGGYARGTTGLSFRSHMAKGTPEIGTEPSAYPGGITMNAREKPVGSIASPNMRRGYADGTSTVTPNSKPTIPTINAPPPVSTTAQKTTIPTTSTTTSTVPNGTTGAGMTTLPFTQSQYYKGPAKAATEALQKTGAVQTAQLKQGEAQAGVDQNSAQGRTAAAELASSQGSQMASTQSQIAQNAQAQIQTQLNQAMQLAYQSGDWGSVNKILTSTGAPAIDFSNLENQRQAGNLGAMAQSLFNLSQSITGTDATSVATKAALAQEATGLIGTQAKTLLGSQFDSNQLSTAIANIQAGQTSDPVTQAFIDHVATVPAQWATNTIAGSGFTDSLENGSAGATLLTQAENGDAGAVQTLAHLTTLAMSNFYNQGAGLSASDKALLQQYGVYTDWSKVSAEDMAYQEGSMDAATSMSYGLSPMSSSDNSSLFET